MERNTKAGAPQQRAGLLISIRPAKLILPCEQEVPSVSAAYRS